MFLYASIYYPLYTIDSIQALGNREEITRWRVLLIIASGVIIPTKSLHMTIIPPEYPKEGIASHSHLQLKL